MSNNIIHEVIEDISYISLYLCNSALNLHNAWKRTQICPITKYPILPLADQGSTLSPEDAMKLPS